jgi:hypothetical protein
MPVRSPRVEPTKGKAPEIVEGIVEPCSDDDNFELPDLRIVGHRADTGDDVQVRAMPESAGVSPQALPTTVA